MKFSDEILDKFVFPNLSKLSAPQIPSIEVIPNYLGSWMLNNAFVVTFHPSVVGLVLAVLRHTDHAVQQYIEARAAFTKYIELLPGRNNTGRLVWEAASKIETTVLCAHHAVGLLDVYSRQCGATEEPAKGGEYDRLRLLANRIKHFNEDFNPNESTLLSPLYFLDAGLHSTTT